MQEIAARTSAERNAPAYTTIWEHLYDELKYLELLVRRELSSQRRLRQNTSLEQFRGLVLSEDEISGLLDNMADPVVDHVDYRPTDSEDQASALAISQMQNRIRERRDASLAQNINLSLPQLSGLFQLTRFEEQCLLISLAPEVDRRYERLYAYLQDDVTRKKPCVDLVINLLCGSWSERLQARLVFETQSPLNNYRLLQMSDSSPDGPISMLSRPLKLDDRIANFLLGFNRPDVRLERFARLSSCEASWDNVPVSEHLRKQIRTFVRARFVPEARGHSVVFYCHGPYGSGRRSLAEAVSADLGIPLLIGDAGKMIAGGLPFEEALWLLGREAALQSAALCIENLDVLLVEEEKYQGQLKSILETVEAFSRIAFLLANRPWRPTAQSKRQPFLDLQFQTPTDRERKSLWEGFVNHNGHLVSDLDLGELASKFRFTPGQMRDALVTAQGLAEWRSLDDRRIRGPELHAACRAQSTQKLGSLARKIEPRHRWADIVLPEDGLVQLHEICLRVAARHRVLGDWGFDRKLSLGKGVSALFAGPSGTGKTMAAEIVAAELELELYKIDLSGIVSKYIGETEKNLDRIFATAENANAILFFDEADALFGKRSEVRDSHDRYANIEIAYLLQKMEQYDGVAILATNLRQNMDEAFTRRLQFIVEFPFPDELNRRRIWQVLFPPEAPRDAEIDFEFLARQFRLSGGNIKNIVLGAAYLAASDGGLITMEHLIRATWRECRKLGQAPGANDFGKYAEVIG